MIPLVNAERAWSQAMEIKAQLDEENVSYKRQHMVRTETHLLGGRFLWRSTGD